MSERIAVLLVDDQALVRAGVRAYLETQPDIEIVGEAASGGQAIALAGDRRPDVVLMDLVMPGMDGIEATRRVRQVSPRSQVIVLTSFHDDAHLFPAIKAGALSYLLKDAGPGEVAAAVRAAARGEAVLHPGVTARVIQEVRGERPPAPAEGEPRTLGAYRLLELVGKGSMGEVYRAQHLRLGREAAVKIMPATLASEPEFRRRFEREAASVASLQHPGILPLWEYGEQGDTPFLVMPYLTGGTLQERLGQGPLPQDEIPPLLRQVAEALDFAHERGIVHRDVKPTNLLLDDRGQLYLADFGIAKALEGAADLTGQGVGVGTPQYMAPEQAQGRAEARSDLYAVGVILYQMLTGQVPYNGRSYSEILMKHLQEPLPLAPLRGVTPPLPEEVDGVLQRALAKAPDDRYPTGRALAEALTNALATGTMKVETPLPAAQTPIGPPPTPGASRTRRLLLLAGFAGVVLLLLLAAGFYLR